MWQSKDFQDVLDCDMRSLIAHWHFLQICKSYRKMNVLIGKVAGMDMQLICEYAAKTAQKLA
jgi:hypothetical protein